MLKSIIALLDKRILPDDEYVFHIRKVVRTYQRARPWCIGFYSVLLLALFCTAALICVALGGLMKLGAQGGPNQWIGWFGFAVGGSFGFTFGMLLHESVRRLLGAIFGVRELRLLLRYHDALCVVNDKAGILMATSGNES